MSRRRSLIVLILITAVLPLVISRNLRMSERTSTEVDPHQLKEGDFIPLFANIVSQSSDGCCWAMNYFDLPFCPPGDPLPNRKKSLEEIVKGDCFTKTQYQLKFKVKTVGKILCEKNLKKHEVKMFRDAISNGVEYRMYYNNILLLGVVGFVKEKTITVDSRTRYYLVKHINFYPHYYNNQVVDIYSQPDLKSAVDISEDAEISMNFTYSVNWKVKINPMNSISLNETAMMKYSEDKNSLIFWAAMLFIWLGLLSTTIVPYLQSYFTRHPPRVVTKFEDGIQCPIHGDECWRPPYSSLLGAVLGTGAQQFLVIILFTYYAIRGSFYACNLSRMLHDMFVLTLYFISSYFSGYFATLFNGSYTTNGRRECILQTAVLYMVPVFLTLVVVNLAAWFADMPDSAAPLGTFIVWGLGTIISTILGGRRGRPTNEPGRHCATKTTQMVIPWWHSWLISTPSQMFLGGLLPFLSILGAMDEIYASFLSLKICGTCSTLLLFFFMIIVMTTLMAVAFTCYQLAWEDFNWWWRSVLRGGSTAIFIFAYGIYFHYRITEGNSGALFISMLYSACFCYALFLVLGTISYYVSFLVYGDMNVCRHKLD